RAETEPVTPDPPRLVRPREVDAGRRHVPRIERMDEGARAGRVERERPAGTVDARDRPTLRRRFPRGPAGVPVPQQRLRRRVRGDGGNAPVALQVHPPRDAAAAPADPPQRRPAGRRHSDVAPRSPSCAVPALDRVLRRPAVTAGAATTSAPATATITPHLRISASYPVS